MTYILENEEAINLVLFKLNAIKEGIDSILKIWEFSSIDEFLEITSKGELDEAVMDAISMRQLVLDLEKYQDILAKLREG
ncbi:MAG: hypothetical protein INQ03_16530 [Candidatus Heimdallarchaeota archaeon]|nr:hypothetical protein [Candidatus Heimdallarchaeota archaeon]